VRKAKRELGRRVPAESRLVSSIAVRVLKELRLA
jgi:hypothetical protein